MVLGQCLVNRAAAVLRVMLPGVEIRRDSCFGVLVLQTLPAQVLYNVYRSLDGAGSIF